MLITWEDRKNRGKIDNQIITEKPALSFDYAWFLVTDSTAQYVETHEEGYYNKDMSAGQRQEVVDYYNAWAPPAPPEPVPPTTEQLLRNLEDARKAAEADGVTINGIRYSGAADNRTTLDEVLKFAAHTGTETITSWKDSDDEYHADHPVSDVQAAYEAIGYRRGALIALESQYAGQIESGELESVDGLSWDVS